MNDHVTPDRSEDDVADLLRPPPPEPPGRREALREQTTRLVRGRRQARQARRGLLLALAYLAGLFTSSWVEPPERSGAPSPWPSHQEAAQAPASPFDLEWDALEADGPRAGHYVRAGDRYLAADALLSAVRCYGRALDEGTPEQRQINPDDNWLLMAIKLARQKEIPHAANDRAGDGAAVRPPGPGASDSGAEEDRPDR